jgi:hypothetical protein
MTEKEKAESLVDEFYQYTNTNSRENAKACARILAKEVIVKLKYNKVMKVVVDYWEDVLIEIDKIPAFKTDSSEDAFKSFAENADIKITFGQNK